MELDRRYFLSSGALAVGALGLPTIGWTQSGGIKDPVVDTAYGKVRGVNNNGVYTFKGIPYGGNTAGANRFMPPTRPTAWSGIRDCVKWGPACPQGNGQTSPVDTPTGNTMSGESALIFNGGDTDSPRSEDCLVLNIFTRGLNDGRKRPVMVWIHGGGFAVGLGAGARTDGTNLARNHDVVSVSLNHRIGVLGYTHLGDLDPAFASSATVGQQDLVAALQWVKQNIAQFGGDPNNVTIHGESGGGAKIHILMAMPAAKGLFHRAVCQSGVVRNYSFGGGMPGSPRRDAATATARKLLGELGLQPGQLRELQNVPVNTLLQAATKVGGGFSPVVGTPGYMETPNVAIAKGSARIPYIVGCVMHEGASGVGALVKTLTEEELVKRVSAQAGANAAEVIAGYRRNHPGWSPGELLLRFSSDGTRFASIKAAEAHIQGGGGSTHMYLFDWQSPVLPTQKAAHGTDCSFYFGNTEALGMSRGNPDAKQLADKMSGAWANFARSAKPTARGLAAWPEYDVRQRPTMIFNSTCKVENDPLGEDRKIWEKFART